MDAEGRTELALEELSERKDHLSSAVLMVEDSVRIRTDWSTPEKAAQPLPDSG